MTSSSSISFSGSKSTSTGQRNSNTFRMLISTDNHLGYAEKDPVRGEDSFRTFQEILQIARDRQVDLMLLAGDLFHDNKPSRKTLYQTMALLRNYCMGDGAVAFQIVSDQSINFPNFGTVNYEDPNFNIELPIFSIHGNHDDPSREAGCANSQLMNQSSSSSLAALDLLSAANFVNYFGKSDKVDAIEVFPILMCKGSTKIAIYGLGNMRDERLHRMFAQQKVVFRRPQENADAWFNIFVVHQNRDDKGRGKKNCLPESFIPDFIDFVIWGHEHECQIDVNESVHGDFYITQPGSSVATSLIEGEAKQKHIGLLEVQGHQFRMQAIELKTVRPFCIEEIILSEIETLNPNDPNVSEEITQVLADKVEEMLIQHLASASPSASASSAPTTTQTPSATKEILVRLRVEHTGFPVLHNQRFGGRFVGRVANPNDILLFYRRKARVVSMLDADGKKKKNLLSDPIRPVRNDTVTIEDLMKDQLQAPEKRLHFLPEGPLALALEEYVVKNIPSALDEFVDQVLEDTQKELVAKKQCQSTEDLREAIEKKQARNRAKYNLNRHVQEEKDNQGEDHDMDEDGHPQNKNEEMVDVGRTRTTRSSPSASAPRSKSKSTSKQRTEKQLDILSSSDEEFQPPSQTKRRGRPSSPAAAATTTPASRRFGAPRGTTTKAKTPPASKAKKKILSSFEDDEEKEDDKIKEDDSMDGMDLDEEENKPRGRASSTRKPPLAPSSAFTTTTTGSRRGSSTIRSRPPQQETAASQEIDLCSSSEEEKVKKTPVKKRKTTTTTTSSKKQPTIAQMFSSQSQAAQSQSQSQFQPLEFANRSRRKSAVAAAQAVQQVAKEERQHADSMRDVLSDHDGDSDFTQDKEEWSQSESQSQAFGTGRLGTSTATKKRKLPLSMLTASQNSQNSQRPSSSTTATAGSAIAARKGWGRSRR